MRIEFPKPLKRLLEESDLEEPIRALANRVGEILSDNKLPFFPDYTDHGTGHINAVLKTEVELVPKAVWDGSTPESDPRLLGHADVALIVGGTVLHDLAMHLRPPGFLELVNPSSRFKPLAWFSEDHEGHLPDRPWPELWQDFELEARRLSVHELTSLLGERAARSWKFGALPTALGEWELNHFLLVGEFLRRHHARLAHEIAIYGFPGVPVGFGEGQFPALGTDTGNPLGRLADLIGLVARSHGTSLRICMAYVESHPLYCGTPRPMGAAVYYPMALLRVADYLQIDRQRAPAVLLQLRSPQNPISVQEWQKHRAVHGITPASDPRGKMITVSSDVSLSLYLQLDELVTGVQAEIDHSTAVLDEAYGTLNELGLNQLNLGTRRVYSNLRRPAFRASLPYVAERTGFTADPNILTLLVKPLYGNYPGVAVRELVQNAADAVRERDAWCASRGTEVTSLDWPNQGPDVLVNFIEQQDGTWLLRITDKGIGMNAETIQHYFLRAGASFRRSTEWAKEFLDESGRPRTIRAGRFGVGAFAVFLIGSSFRMTTRHISARPSMGYAVAASSNSQVVEIKRERQLPMGTTIEVVVQAETADKLRLNTSSNPFWRTDRFVDWYCWQSPVVRIRIESAARTATLTPEFELPIPKVDHRPDWAEIRPEGFDAVYWSFAKAPAVSCNGIKVNHPEATSNLFDWPPSLGLGRPNIAVVDSLANLPLTVQRYQLSNDLPFRDILTTDVILSFIAHLLVHGPASRVLKLDFPRHPLAPSAIVDYGNFADRDRHRLRWISTRTHVVPEDPWLHSLLNADRLIVYGAIGVVTGRDFYAPTKTLKTLVTQSPAAVMSWMGHVSEYEDGQKKAQHYAREVFLELTEGGVSGLHQHLEWGRLLSSEHGEFEAFGAPDKSNQARDRRLRNLIQAIRDGVRAKRMRRPVVFAAELKSKRTSPTPKTHLALTWNECLGPVALPFDAVARRALVARGREHSGLRRHIDAWEALRPDGQLPALATSK